MVKEEEEEESPRGIHYTQLTELLPAGGASRCNNKGGETHKQPCFQTKILSMEKVGTIQVTV